VHTNPLAQQQRAFDKVEISSKGVTHNIVLANLTIWAQVFCKFVPTLIALLQHISSHKNTFLVLTVRKSVWDVTVFILR
jgi:hypothetical protein